MVINQKTWLGFIVNRHQKLLRLILTGTSDANVSFSDLLALLRYLGFDERVKGSHHIFRKAGIEERPNLQKDGSKAKIYQVRQIRAIILKHKLAENMEPGDEADE